MIALWRTAWRLLQAAWRTVALLVVLALVALNIATVMFDAVFRALSAVAELVVPDRTVAARQRSAIADADERLQTEAGQRDARERALREDLDEKRRARTTSDAARGRAVAGLDAERTARAATMADLDLLRRQGDDAADAIDDLSARMLRRSARAAARAPGVLIGSAIPFAGTGIDLAGTVFDLTDACETARDMTALRAEMNLDETGEAGVICAAIDRLPTVEEILGGAGDKPCAETLSGTGVDPALCPPPPRPTDDPLDETEPGPLPTPDP